MNQATARSIRFEKGLLGALFCFWADDDLRVAKPRVLWIKRSFISRRGRVKTTKTLCSNPKPAGLSDMGRGRLCSGHQLRIAVPRPRNRTLIYLCLFYSSLNKLYNIISYLRI